MEKQNFTTELHKCCSSDKKETRLWAKAIHFNNGFAYASEGHVLIKSSLEYHSVINPENLEGKAMHKDNFKEIIKFDVAECLEDGISCKSVDGQVAFYEYFNMEGTKAPDFNKVIPSGSEFKSLFQVGLNPTYVSKLSDAMFYGESCLRYRFTGQNSAILVDATGF